jgi:hypothetical protein
MTNAPLTEQDFYGVYVSVYEKVQSAKRLLRWELLNAEVICLSELPDKDLTEREMLMYAAIRHYMEQVNKIPDACFQISNGDEEK